MDLVGGGRQQYRSVVVCNRRAWSEVDDIIMGGVEYNPESWWRLTAGVLSRILVVADSRGSSSILNGGIIPVVPIVVFPEMPCIRNN